MMLKMTFFLCYPDEVEISEKFARVSWQSLFNHTARRNFLTKSQSDLGSTSVTSLYSYLNGGETTPRVTVDINSDSKMERQMRMMLVCF